MVRDLNEVVVACDSSTSGQTGWLQYPDVIVACQVELGESLLILLKQLFDLFKQLVFAIVFRLVLVTFDYWLALFLFFLLLFLLGFLHSIGTDSIEFAIDGFQPFLVLLLG